MAIAYTQSIHPRGVDWPSELRAAGLKATQPRQLVLTFLDEHPHSDADEIFTALAPIHPTLSIQAVHGVVNDLTTAGLIRRIDLPQFQSLRYETRINDNHHHIQCVKCGRIEDVDCVVGETPCLTPAQTHGMQILAAHVSFQGICADCARDMGTTGGPTAKPTTEPTTNPIKQHANAAESEHIHG